MEQPNSAHGAGDTAAFENRPASPQVWSRLFAGMALLAVGMVAGGLVMHFALERPALESAQARILAMEQVLSETRAQLQESGRKMVALEGQLRVEESTRRGLESALRSTQEDLGRAQDTLAFYEQLLPPGKQGVVTIRALDVQRVGPHLSYRLLLMRSGSNEKPFQGQLQFLAEGALDGEKVSLTLLPADGQQPETETAGEPEDMLAVELENFQRGSGVLALPEGFEPQAITVNVLEGRNIRATHRMELANGN